MKTDSRYPTPEEIAFAIEAQKTFHKHPELSLEEHATATRLREYISSVPLGEGISMEFVDSTTTPGFVCVLRNGEGPCVGYRADMDGLPVQEETGLEFASQNQGVMHACGHDSHMAVFMAAARYFATRPAAWKGTIVFIAQAAEESAAGARMLVEEGIWERIPHPEVMYGAHVVPRPAGWLSLYPGGALPGCQGFHITVHGQGGHGSQPHTAVDPIVIGAAIVMRLQTIVSRMANPDRTAVVTVGKFSAGTTDNIIPPSAELLINTRFRDAETGRIIRDGIARIARAEAEASGAPEPTIRQIRDAGATINDPEETENLRTYLRANPGDTELNVVSEPFGFSEDFAQLGEAIGVPNVFWLYGGMGPKQVGKFGDNPPPNHSPFFYADPETSLSPALHVAISALLSKVGQ